VELECPTCRKKIELEQRYFYHAGRSNQGLLYCDRDPTVLVFSTYDSRYVQIVGEVHPWMLDFDQKAEIEEHLVGCPCGGSFSFSNPPRCPYCGGSLQSALPSSMHYVIVGRLIDGDREPIWKD
jgi:hypothetical protein